MQPSPQRNTRTERNLEETATRFIQIDEEGYFKLEDTRVSDTSIGHEWMSKVKIDDRGRPVTIMDEEEIIIEAFDEPFVAVDVEKGKSERWTISVPYGHSDTFMLSSLTLDPWDRFHGRTEHGVPFVFSRATQARFFNLCDEFDDDAITVDGRRIETQPWLQENPEANNEAWWTDLYAKNDTRWDLNAPTPALPAIAPRLKLQRSRILVLGAGTGNDAAWFAEQGHLVTAVDFSAEAIARAQAKYAHLPDLKFIQADVFNLPASMNGSFDIIFEHTLYCAISPEKRTDLVKVWRRLLSERGHIMGVFFTMDKPKGPPYGGSEWEIRQRLSKTFRTLYWMRLRNSLPQRLGQELFVYAEKLPLF
jgi:SAM-dependent methyltransferase